MLGTAQDGGYPHTGCSDDCCKEAWEDSNQKRLIASLAVLDGKDCFLVDITPDFKYQLQLIERHINGNAPDAGTPFGGYRQSGNGREGGTWGIEEYLEVKTISGWK